MKFFEKNWISKFSFFNFGRKKIFDREFFEKFFLQPPNFFIRMILNTKNGNYMKV